MGVKLGPVLSFRGIQGSGWGVSALVVVAAKDGAPKLVVAAAANSQPPAVSVKSLGQYPDLAPEFEAFRFDFSIPLGANERSVEYTIGGGTKYSFTVPSKDAIPQSVYVSCNGFSSLKLLNQTRDATALWRDVAARHSERPYHLLLMGGDQVYADSMWDSIAELHEWAALPIKQRVARKFTQSLARKVDQFYAELYPERWSHPDVQATLASIPTVMMWDDHDIFDGWGSHSDQLQECEVFKGIFAAARKYFALYQLHLAPGEVHPMAIPGQGAFSLGFKLGPLVIAAIDMRSERTSSQVIGFESWKAIYDWIDALPQKAAATAATHLYLLTSIPVIYPDFSLIEKTLDALPGVQEIEDDLRDHWNSQPHKEERLRLIHRLLNFSADKLCRVTLLSGDVHVGALGLVRSVRTDADPPAQLLTQLTSSGVMHPPPPGVVLYFLENVMGKKTEEDRDITSEMVCFPGSRNYYIGARNWLALESDPGRRIWARWHVEGAKYPLTKVIHPIGFDMKKAIVPPRTEE